MGFVINQPFAVLANGGIPPVETFSERHSRLIASTAGKQWPVIGKTESAMGLQCYETVMPKILASLHQLAFEIPGFHDGPGAQPLEDK
jgi:hypothetical protein